MKGKISIFLALLLVLSFSSSSAWASDDIDASTTANGVVGHCKGSSGGGGQAGDDDGPNGDLEGDPENWLGGQNSVVDPVPGHTRDFRFLEWIQQLLSELMVWLR